MLPNPLPKIYTLVAKEASLLQPLSLSSPNHSCLAKEAIQRIWTELHFIQNQVNLNRLFCTHIYRILRDDQGK